MKILVHSDLDPARVRARYDKVLSFDEAQEALYRLPSPIAIIGSAGSGKTALALENPSSLKAAPQLQNFLRPFPTQLN